MSAPLLNTNQDLGFTPQALDRALWALRCSPFRGALFQQMIHVSVPLGAITGGPGFREGWTRRPLGENQVERSLMWLIQVGVLRREVDGQGITDSFRLTPLGRRVLHQWLALGEPSGDPWHRLGQVLRYGWRLGF